MEHPEQELEDIIGRRLLTNVNETEDQPVKQDAEIILSLERGEGLAVDEEAPDSEAHDIDVAGADANLPTTFAKVEKSLISLGFFTPSSRRVRSQNVKRISFIRDIDGKRVEATAEFHPSAVFGLPVTADQDKYLALQDMITDLLRSNGKIANPIRFTSANLLRLLHRRVQTGKNYKDISEWLDVMTATTIVSNGVVYEAGKKRYARDRFHVFERAVSVGKELPDGTIADANYIWLSEWQLENINQNFLLPIDLETYRKLKNHIAKALAPLIQIWLYASQKKGSFEKRYDELCEMLGLQVHKVPSLITRQLKPSLDELTRHEYLKNWRIEKTSDQKAYKVILYHGSKFHRDQRKRREQKNQATEPVVIAQSEMPEVGLLEPGKLDRVPTPQPKLGEEHPRSKAALTGSIAPERDLAVVEDAPKSQDTSDKGPELVDQLVDRGLMASGAIKLLVRIGPNRLDEVQDFIEYWDFQKRAGKDVGPGLLYDLIKNSDPLPSSFETSRQRRAREAAHKKRALLQQAQQSLKFAHERYRDETLDRYIAEEFPKEEYDRLYEVRKQELSKQGSFFAKYGDKGKLFNDMVHHTVRSDIALTLNFLPFDEFCRKEAPRILVDYGIDPAELGISAPVSAESSAPSATE